MTSHGVLDRAIAAIATLACFGFVAGLFDVATLPPLAAPFAPPPPAVAPRGAELNVRVLAGGDWPADCTGPDAGAARDCSRKRVGADATRVASATVRVFWVHENRYYLAGVGRTDSAGHVTLTELPRGSVWVLAEAPGLARGSSQLVLGAGQRAVTIVLWDAYQLRVRVFDERSQPLGRATVLVTGADPLPFGALTGSDGVAAFNRVPAAPWRVKVSAPGHESVTRTGVRGDITVALRHLGSLQVRVEEPGGAPSIGATVAIAGSKLWPARRAATDGHGTARVVGLLSGSYDLRAYRGSLVSKTVFGVTLERGQQQTVTLRLEPGRMVTAVVTDGEADDAARVADADVVLVEGGLSSFPLRGRTSRDGTLALGPIASGPATLSARASGFVPTAALPVPEPLEGPIRIALLRGATLTGEVVDRRGHPVDGASVEVIGTDLYGLPISETPVLQAFRSSHFSWSLAGPLPLIPMGELGVMPGPVPPIPRFGFAAGAPASIPTAGLASDFEVGSTDPWVTRADGTFRAHPVTPGRVRALVRHPAYVQGFSEPVSIAPGGTARVRVVLGVGGTLEGSVVDDRDFPVAGARVDVTSVSGTFERTTLSASDGTFAFASVPERVWISVARPDDPAHIVLREEVQVKSDERTELKLSLPAPRGGSRVVVVDEHEQPVDGVQVTMLSLDPHRPLRRTLFTGADGSVTFDDTQGLKLRVLAEATGFTRAVSATEEMPETLHIALRRGVIVTGSVTARRGRQLLAGAAVTLVSEGLRRTVVTDQAGAYRIHDVPLGPARLVVSHSEFASAELTVEVEGTGFADRPFELATVDLQQPGAVAGEVINPNGEPVAGARVAVGFAPAYLPIGVPTPLTAVTDAQGQFKIDGLSPGDVSLQAYASQVGRGEVQEIPVSSGRTTADVRIRLTEAAGDPESVATGSVAVTLGERGTGEVRVLVVHVAELSEAERAGLEVGDIVLRVDGVEPRDAAEARTRLSGPAGSDVVVDVQRDGETLSLRLIRERVRR